jgi:hypothetical protein
MHKATELDKQWHELMFLCEKESICRRQGNHPKLLELITNRIAHLARQMGFTSKVIQSREFRAERSGRHILRIAADAADIASPTGP